MRTASDPNASGLVLPFCNVEQGQESLARSGVLTGLCLGVVEQQGQAFNEGFPFLGCQLDDVGRRCSLALLALHRASPGVMSRLAADAAQALTSPTEPRFCAMSQLHQSAVKRTPFFEQRMDGLFLELVEIS